MVMQCKRSEIQFDEKSFFMLCEIDDIKGSVLLEDDCRYLMVRYLWSVYL